MRQRTCRLFIPKLLICLNCYSLPFAHVVGIYVAFVKVLDLYFSLVTISPPSPGELWSCLKIISRTISGDLDLIKLAIPFQSVPKCAKRTGKTVSSGLVQSIESWETPTSFQLCLSEGVRCCSFDFARKFCLLATVDGRGLSLRVVLGKEPL